MNDLPPIGSVVVLRSGRAEYEVVAHACGAGSIRCPHGGHAVSVYELRKGVRRWSSTQCLDSRTVKLLHAVTDKDPT